LEIRKRVKKLNKYVELLHSISNEDFKVCDSKVIPEFTDNKFIIASTNIPKLLLIHIHQNLHKKFGNLLETQNFFTDPVKLNNHQIWSDFNKVCKQSVKLNIFVDCSKGVKNYLSNIFINEKLNFIFVVSNESQSEALIKTFNEKKFKDFSKVEINYNWNDLTEESQESLLQTKINFQNNSQITLISLLENIDEQSSAIRSTEDLSAVINDKLLNLLVDNHQISINSDIEKDPTEKYFDLLFQERIFKKRSDEAEVRKMNISERALLLHVKNKKYVLISDIAGNGKSWVMKNFKEVLRIKYPTKWVTYVDLKQFINDFKGNNQESKFLNFIAEKILKLKKYEEGMFKRLYKNGKVVILFDGFDEIAPDCAEFVTKLIKSFEYNEGNQLWIATRDYFRINLLHELNLNVSYSIKKLSKEDGKNLIAEKWILSDMKEHTDIKSRDEFIEYLKKSSNFKIYQQDAEKLIEEIQMSEMSSIGMPQLFKMIAEGFKKNENAAQNLCFGEIFSKFIESLCKRWSHEKGQIRADASIVCQKYELSFWIFHQYSAIKGVFPELLNFLFPGYDGSEWPVEEVIACGLMTKKGDFYYFLHQTFREFFIADFFAKLLKKMETDSYLKQKCLENNLYTIIARILTKENFWVIQVFFNDSIDCSTLDKIQPEMQKLINNFYEIEKFCNLFTKNLEKLADFILKILSTGNYEKVKKILKESSKNITLEMKHSKMFEKFYTFLFDFLKTNDLKDLIANQEIFLNIISSNLEINDFEKFVEITKQNTDDEFIQKNIRIEIYDYMRFNIFCCLCCCKNLTAYKVQKCLDITKRFLSIEEIFRMMQICSIKKYNILMNCYILNENNFRIIWQEIENFYSIHGSTNYFIELVKQKHFGDKTIFHEVAFSYEIESHKTTWQLLSKTFPNQEELKDFVIAKKEYDGNYFHILVNRNKFSFSLLFDVFEIAKNKITDAQFKEILKSKNSRNKNILKIAASGKDSIFEVLWKLYQHYFKLDEFLLILNENDALGRNILNIAAENNYKEVFNFLIEKLDSISTPDEIKKIIINSGRYRANLLYSAAKNQSQGLHKILWKALKKYFKSTEILDFLKYVDDDGDNLLFRTVYDNTRNTLEVTWNEIKSVMNENEQIKYLETKGKGGKNLVERDYKNQFHKDEAYEWVKERMIEYKIYKYNENHELVKI